MSFFSYPLQALVFSFLCLFFGPAHAMGVPPSNLPNPRMSEPPYPLDTPLEGPSSFYTQRVLNIIRNWPPKDLLDPKEFPKKTYQILGITTPKDDFYVGLRKSMFILAPLSAVERTIDNYEDYLSLFPEFKIIRVISKDRNKTNVYWERVVPVPFVPNTQYEMSYLSDKNRPNVRFYRYQLKSSNVLKASDGIVVLEKVRENLTRFTAYDFYNAEWGIAKVLAPGRIWGDSIEGAYRSDVSLKLKSESPLLSKEELQEVTKRYVEANKRPAVDFAEFKDRLPAGNEH
jgi:hypothetical protein